MRPYRLLVLVAALSAPIVSACTPAGALMGVGATTGLAAYQERGLDGMARDVAISSRIMEIYGRNDHTLIPDINVEVYEGRALLTGVVNNEDRRATAVRLAWQVDGVRDVLNEILIDDGSGGMLDAARDAWISTSLESKLTFDQEVYAVNYVIETIGGRVYLMGIAQDDRELERVVNHARSISYVQRVISHVRVKEPIDGTSTAALPPEN